MDGWIDTAWGLLLGPAVECHIAAAGLRDAAEEALRPGALKERAEKRNGPARELLHG